MGNSCPSATGSIVEADSYGVFAGAKEEKMMNKDS
jgi:hypothetical protein